MESASLLRASGAENSKRIVGPGRVVCLKGSGAERALANPVRRGQRHRASPGRNDAMDIQRVVSSEFIESVIKILVHSDLHPETEGAPSPGSGARRRSPGGGRGPRAAGSSRPAGVRLPSAHPFFHTKLDRH